jgi:hypothetical protein
VHKFSMSLKNGLVFEVHVASFLIAFEWSVRVACVIVDERVNHKFVGPHVLYLIKLHGALITVVPRLLFVHRLDVPPHFCFLRKFFVANSTMESSQHSRFWQCWLEVDVHVVEVSDEV